MHPEIMGVLKSANHAALSHPLSRQSHGPPTTVVGSGFVAYAQRGKPPPPPCRHHHHHHQHHQHQHQQQHQQHYQHQQQHHERTQQLHSCCVRSFKQVYNRPTSKLSSEGRGPFLFLHETLWPPPSSFQASVFDVNEDIGTCANVLSKCHENDVLGPLCLHIAWKLRVA